MINWFVLSIYFWLIRQQLFPRNNFIGLAFSWPKLKSNLILWTEKCVCVNCQRKQPLSLKCLVHLHLAVSHISFMVALQQTVSCPKLYTNSVYRGIQITLCIAQQQYNLQRLDLCQAKLGLCTPKDETELLTGCLNSVWPHGVVHVSLPSVLRFGTCLHFLARRHKGALDVVWRWCDISQRLCVLASSLWLKLTHFVSSEEL